MARESLLHQRGSRTREAKNENRLGAVLPGRAWGHQAQALGDEELPQTVGYLAGFALEIGLAGNFARPLLGRRETGEGFIVALELVEDAPLLQEHVGIGGSGLNGAGLVRLELGKRVGKLALPREQRRASDLHSWIVGPDLGRTVELVPGCGKVAVHFFELAPAEKGLKYIRRGLRGFAVEFTGLCDLSLAFEIPGQIGKQDG